MLKSIKEDILREYGTSLGEVATLLDEVSDLDTFKSIVENSVSNKKILTKLGNRKEAHDNLVKLGLINASGFEEVKKIFPDIDIDENSLTSTPTTVGVSNIIRYMESVIVSDLKSLYFDPIFPDFVSNVRSVLQGAHQFSTIVTTRGGLKASSDKEKLLESLSDNLMSISNRTIYSTVLDRDNRTDKTDPDSILHTLLDTSITSNGIVIGMLEKLKGKVDTFNTGIGQLKVDSYPGALMDNINTMVKENDAVKALATTEQQVLKLYNKLIPKLLKIYK